MIIDRINQSRTAGGSLKISSVMNDRELWFEVPQEERLSDTYADCFLIMGLPLSMLRNEPLELLNYPVSQALLDNLVTVQKILNAWNSRFAVIEIKANGVTKERAGTGTISFFSGGIDSINTLITQQVNKALFISGFDLSASSDQVKELSLRNTRILDHFSVGQVVVRTNQQEWGVASGIARDFWYSGYLAAVAVLFEFGRALVPSSHTYATLNPGGSHLILDRFWSNGSTTFEHVDAEYSRAEKIRNIAVYPQVLNDLHVCWRDSTKNCGMCDKCVRTMIALSIIGVQGPFPGVISPRQVAKVEVAGWQSLDYAIDNMRLAHKLGKSELVKAIRKSIKRYDRGQMLKYFDLGVLGGLGHKWRRRRRPYKLREGFTRPRADLELD